jgi:hypothetical protein
VNELFGLNHGYLFTTADRESSLLKLTQWLPIYLMKYHIEENAVESALKEQSASPLIRLQNLFCTAKFAIMRSHFIYKVSVAHVV